MMPIETPEQKARKKIDKQLNDAGWDIVPRDEYVPKNAQAVEEMLMQGNKESDYLLFVDDKAIAVVEAKREENSLGDDVADQAEFYATHPQNWYGLWLDGFIPLVYMANGKKIYFKDMRDANSDYVELNGMHSPKQMLKIINGQSEYGALPRLERRGLRDCQYRAELKFEEHLKYGKKRNLAILATGSGKTYLACLASYRLLNYTPARRILFLVDRNNLARQTEAEFSQFDRTEGQQEMSSLYRISRLRKPADIKSEIVISTIQKLFAVMTGQSISEMSEDAEDERTTEEEEKKAQETIVLGDDIQVPPDYFDLIIVDECHRSIYGKWKAVLDYFTGATVLGLTATPTPEAFAFFDMNIVENYTYDQSVVDGVNVPFRVYRIKTQVTEHGGAIKEGTTVTETSRKTGEKTTKTVHHREDYSESDLDRSIVNEDQIREVLTAYRNAIYTELYPDREERWEYVPKTLIFAKDDRHASEILEGVRDVFGPLFEGGEVPDNFVQKITYSSDDSNGLIRDLRIEKDFRIAITVTLVATGTDVKPLEVVLFMKDVNSDVLYTQMKGRGCRVVKEDRLREVTPNAITKDCYYIVDAIGVTEHDKVIPHPATGQGGKKILTLEQLLEHLAHNELSDENLVLLRDYCATINMRYEGNRLFGHHLDYFINSYGFAPKTIAANIQTAIDNGLLDVCQYIDPSHNNTERMNLIYQLIGNIDARKKLLEMQRGYVLNTDEDPDELIYAGFSQETAKKFIDNFEHYLTENKDSIEALRIIYNSEDTLITHTMLTELQERLLAESRQYTPYNIWKNYKVIDDEGNVDELDTKTNVHALTHLIQIVRYAYGKNRKLTSLITGYAKRFALYCGQAQRVLTADQVEIMRQVAEFVINDGAITLMELNEIDTDLWRRGVTSFGAPTLATEMQTLSNFLLKAA
ncbi:type I restriction endonuclease subunit R [Gordonibacter urolithinfaciens]|uniref:DEAD/DEAH box helicase n=1 Tax=Gordonibacter urolithinfaciens TaxID=1335613 RepID=A0A6N8ILP4_9ACTN|nr:type I restriction endonuclease subunit R [Gordonibacter urolithinfaciens]MVM55809.1 DEAD/DEAH box helicase [Gordonibacter urolithinfaciens]MVN16216.1 DEAD/DEAH box helicase [Gordonibacter urolithinfaciens]MVN39544.1 DEAD/DEAH box helicase [Gordonibacter urolithinfaciens]MVN56850.1 DEAD/DEAH box helicase [Gordonibacter urolithinfaciens]MVN60924.1 DEAD/DEAH box helicase [Gordonibacter urolithinfaciens]